MLLIEKGLSVFYMLHRNRNRHVMLKIYFILRKAKIYRTKAQAEQLHRHRTEKANIESNNRGVLMLENVEAKQNFRQ